MQLEVPIIKTQSPKTGHFGSPTLPVSRVTDQPFNKVTEENAFLEAVFSGKTRGIEGLPPGARQLLEASIAFLDTISKET